MSTLSLPVFMLMMLLRGNVLSNFIITLSRAMSFFCLDLVGVAQHLVALSCVLIGREPQLSWISMSDSSNDGMCVPS